MGDVLRSAGAKRLLQTHASKFRQTSISIRQWGILLPGACESLIHWRTTAKQAAWDGVIDPVVVADLDMKNYFNTAERLSIRASLQRHFVEACPDVAGEQQQPGVTLLPDGAAFKFDRGAEQGEPPIGLTRAALPLGDAIKPLREQEFLRWACEEWFTDDGQLARAPEVFDAWLRAFDGEIAKFGATRGHGDSVKSVARLVCPPTRVADFQGWDTAYVRSACKVEQPNSHTEVLGATIGSNADYEADAFRKCSKIQRKGHAIESLGHTPTELVLTRRCGDVGNFNYWLRCYGDIISHGPSVQFDRGLRASMSKRWPVPCLIRQSGKVAWVQDL